MKLKPPSGYARINSIAIEVYSDAVTYYLNEDKNAKVEVTIYKGDDYEEQGFGPVFLFGE